MKFSTNIVRSSWFVAMPCAALLLTSTLGYAQDFLPVPDPDAIALFAGRGAVAGTQAFLGVAVAEVTSGRAHDLKLKEEHGVEVTRVDEDSAAGKSGIKVGDVVLEYNGQRVEGTEQFVRLVRETPAGREVKLLISRNGTNQTVAATMGSRKAAPAVLGRNGDWFNMPEIPMPDMPRVFTTWNSSLLGIEAESLSAQLGDFFGVKEGVLVRSVSKGSAAEKAGIKAGDVLVKIDQTGVSSPGDVTSAVRSARSKGSFPVVLIRNKQETTVSVTLESSGEAPKARVRGHSVKM